MSSLEESISWTKDAVLERQSAVLPLDMVDNSAFFPGRLTARLTVSILALQGSSPSFPFQTARILMTLHVFVLLLVVCLLLLLVRLGRLDCFPLQPCSSPGVAKRTGLHRLLKPRCSDDCPACRLATPASLCRGPAPGPVRPWREVKSRRGARHPGQHRRLRLSEPAVQLLREHRCALSCTGWRWQAWPGRTHPDVAVSGLPHHDHVLDETRPCTI
jgi:hypothetical protein